MSSYSLTKARTFQYVGILLVLAAIATGYWYFFARAGATLNKSSVNSLTSGLVGYWTFDGADISGTTATDRSGSGNNGTLTNGPTKAIGKLGQGLNFDFVDDVVTTSQAISGSISATTATLSAWVKPGTQYDTSGVPFNLGCIICDSGGYIGIYRGSYAGIGHDAIVVANYSGSDYFVEANSTAVNTREWAHIVLVHSGGILSAYSNGVFIGSVSSGNTSNLTGSWKIGSTNFNGTIDEVRVYNRALSASEIKALYDLGSSDKVNASASQPQGTGRLDSGLAGYWKLDENTGTSAGDASTNAITAGTLTNGPTWATGRIGSGVDFDGLNDYTTITDPGTGSALDFSTGDTITITAWINPDTLPGGGQIIASKGATTGSNNSNYQFFVSGTGELTLGFNEGSTSWNDYHTGGGLISTGTWQFVVATMTYESGTASGHIYHNGVEQEVFIQANPATNAASVSNDPLWIGAENEAGGAAVDMPFDGKIDEVRIYRRALSADEVADLYRLTTPTGVDTSLKGYWSFNGSDISGTTAYDRSGSRNDGTLTNGPTKAIGKLGQALNFDGVDDYVTVADPGTGSVLDFANGTSITMSVWIKPDTFDGTYGVMASKEVNNFSGSANYQAYHQNCSGSSCQFGFAYDTGSCNGTGWNTFLTTAPGLTAGQWQHVIVTYTFGTGSTAKLYLNGVEQTASWTAGSGNLAPCQGDERIIIGHTYDGDMFDGAIDEVRIYNRALSATEIQSLYDLGAADKVNSSVSQPQGSGRLDSGLAGYWKLDENTGTSAGDASTNGNTGTLTNGPTWTTGRIGSAVNFDGVNDEIGVSDAPALDFGVGEAFSYAGWFNLSAVDGNEPLVMKSANDVSQGYGLYIHTTDLFNIMLNDATDDCSDYVDLNTTLTGAWHHYVWSVDTSHISRLYVDGSLRLTTDCSVSGDLSNADDLSLGWMYSGASQYFSGKQDDVRLYDRALSADEVADLYRLTTPTGVDTSLKGYWTFDGADISGTTATDRSGSGNNGTLTNGPTKAIGKLGQALQFDGTDDDISIADAPVLDFGAGAAFSYAGWFNLDAVNGNEPLVMKSASDISQGYGLFIHTTDLFNIILNDATDDCSAYVDLNTSLIGAWHHYVWSVDTSHISRLYVDGSLRLTTDCSVSGDLSNADDLSLGWMYAGTSQYFSGKQDDVRLYNRALSADEVTQLYNLGR